MSFRSSLDRFGWSTGMRRASLFIDCSDLARQLIEGENNRPLMARKRSRALLADVSKVHEVQ
jgi:hypothetical protein